jgi:hypothetical protein
MFSFKNLFNLNKKDSVATSKEIAKQKEEQRRQKAKQAFIDEINKDLKPFYI